MPLYLTESDIAMLVSPADAVEAVEGCFRRMAAGEVEIAPRGRSCVRATATSKFARRVPRQARKRAHKAALRAAQTA